MNRRAFLFTSGSGVSLAVASQLGWASAASAATNKPQIGSFGIDLAGRDLSISPGDDFWKYGGGTWMKNNPIPADRVSWGPFDQLAAKAEVDVRAIIDDLSAKTSAPGSIEQKIGDFYRSFMDTTTIDAAGIAPLQADLDLIAAAKTHDDIAAIFGKPDLPTPAPIGWGVGLDDGNPDRYIVTISHGGLGMPERDYYLKDDARFKELRDKYPAHIARLLTLAGQRDGASKAAAIMALETEIAKRHWPITDRRDSTKMYNPRTRAQLDEIAPDFPWAVAFKATGLTDIQDCIVGEVTAMGPLATLFKNTPVDTWKAYLTYHLISNSASMLPKAIDDENFDFYGKTLNGQVKQRDRWKRGTQAVNGALGEGIGQVYVQRHFSPSAKAKMLVLVENLRKAFKVRIEGLSWMSAETKVKAMRKLATFNPKIGYPDKWRDYSDLEIKAGDPIGNARRVQAFNVKRDLEDLKKKTDKTRWFMTPQTVNAYYNPIFNEIVFPAAILQPPFFDEFADPAVNYGAIGGVIGHEMGHGFDDQGAKYDENGVLRDWWTPADVKAFEALGTKMVTQYNGFQPLPGVNINGQLTIGENIGDHCGVVVGHVAYQLSLAGRPAPVIDGLTGDQRFYLAWAQVWRAQQRDEALRNQVQSDPHSPAQYRVNGTVQNVDGWYQAFNVKPGNTLYVAPKDRVRIW
ncbi:M13 family metallopeptidase [Candidatus Phycosocius spiralis]|uniref:Zinc metalloprotease n=1 Tax=Candidatus Phycosocius spiralis TaxID=2815099 RepID=A0ABQ4PVR5_9PROT|nr:M13-type metalloendopeptidase [Candidatus Phycosocius spiralis]GIU67075.1 zinc metalloprotease [Candidatus Phycosocius spiralis]